MSEPASLKPTVAFIGLGLMGGGMARSLLRAGFRLRLYNRTGGKAAEVARGTAAIVCATPAEAVTGAEFVVTMLADPTALFTVVTGVDGLLGAISPGAVLIDSSTVTPSASLRVRDLLLTRGAEMLDAPVFGSKDEAEKGALGFIVGGEPAVLARAQPVLDAMGRTRHVGVNGLGAQAKLAVNLVMAGTLQAFGESMVLATKAGIAPDTMLEIILSSRARSGIIEMKAPHILARDFRPFFPLELMAKDLRLVQDSAAALGATLPLAAALRDHFARCVAAGLAHEDFCAAIKPVEQSAALEVKSARPAAQP
ncbi:MAG: hypothetical protein RLZZ15_3279 [Verrucomicrobiota bacterium]|jgi:3-hydroxyisobutyrate dehydrogenase